MKKHIIGLALFSFIVSAAAIVYAIFNVPEIASVAATQYIVAERTHCKMKRAANRSTVDAPMVTQAVFDLKTKQLNWELAAPQRSGSTIALHFFVKDANGTRYLNSAFAPQMGFENGGIKATNSYEWLDRLESYENLYIVPELASWNKYQKRQPKFDAEKATSVLLYSGEQGDLTEKYFKE